MLRSMLAMRAPSLCSKSSSDEASLALNCSDKLLLFSRSDGSERLLLSRSDVDGLALLPLMRRRMDDGSASALRSMVCDDVLRR